MDFEFEELSVFEVAGLQCGAFSGEATIDSEGNVTDIALDSYHQGQKRTPWLQVPQQKLHCHTPEQHMLFEIGKRLERDYQNTICDLLNDPDLKYRRFPHYEAAE